MASTKETRVLDWYLETSEAGIATRLRLKRAASGTQVLKLRKALDTATGDKARELRQELAAERALARTANGTVQVPTYTKELNA